MGEELKLRGAWANPFSRRSALLLEYNPVHKKIPVLVHKGKPIAESLVILEYIDETWKDNPILPQDPYERAMARFWANFSDEKCSPALWKYCWSCGEEREKTYEEAYEVLKILEGELKDKKFFGGNHLGFVDIAANVLGFWIGVVQEAVGVDILAPDRFPRLCKWAEGFRSYPVVKENLPERDRLYAVFKARFEKISGSKDAESVSRH
ncbi:hypothetical protein BT93_K0525 [Corymbia citriodora subsp. variegata]|nr:hypothetical protein BT93_K0525 [Corymbia citriodora subsp. variegata]